MMNFLEVKILETFSEQKFYWLGAAFLILAVLALILTRFVSKPALPSPVFIPPTAISIPDVSQLPSGKSIFDKTNFLRVQENYQRSYLDLISRINQYDTTSIDVKKARRIFSSYRLVKTRYKQVTKKINNYSKDYKLRCFAKMKTIILAVLYYDRKFKTRMTRYDVKELLKIGALKKEPKCPQNGKYSIIYKDGRRFFHCSVHGVLRN